MSAGRTGTVISKTEDTANELKSCKVEMLKR
jgi:hypothetical protein